MSWKKIATLIVILGILIAAILIVHQKEKQKEAKEGRLMDFSSSKVYRLQIDRGNRRFTFLRKENSWEMEEPIKTKADRIAVENILDEFSSLKYDREVEKNAPDLKPYGLDKPQIEVRLFEKDQTKPSYIIQLGILNKMDSSSYVKLAAGNDVVMIPSYRRNYLEKEVFDFREKKFLGIESTETSALDYSVNNRNFSFTKKEDKWMMEKPIFSMADEAKVTDILSRASTLEAKAFLGAASDDKLKEFGFDKPLVEATFKQKEQSKTVKIVKKEEKYFSYTPDFGEICEIEKDFSDKFIVDVKSLRSTKVAPFYSFDAKEIRFKGPQVQFEMKKNKDNAWELAAPASKEKVDEEKVNSLLSDLETLNATDFIDQPQDKFEFIYSVQLTIQEPSAKTTTKLDIQLTGTKEDFAIVKNSSLPYYFKVSKDIVDKMPKALVDLLKKPTEEIKK